MHTIETILTVTEKGEILIPILADLPPGKHKAVLVIEDAPVQQAATGKQAPIRLHSFALTTGRSNATYSRQEIYENDDR